MRGRLPLMSAMMSAMMLALGVMPEPEPVLPRAPRRREDEADAPPPGRPANPRKKAQRKAQRAARRKGRR